MKNLSKLISFAILAIIASYSPIMAVGLMLSAFAVSQTPGLRGSLMISASIFNPYDITFNGKQVQDISETILEEVYNVPELTLFHKIIPNIKAQQQIGLLGLMGMKGLPSTSCAPSATGAVIPASLKSWMPITYQDRETFCSEDLRATFFTWAMKNGLDAKNLEDSDFMKFIVERTVTGIKDAAYRISWMSNKNAAHFNHSPAGYFSNSTNLNFFNGIDGFWPQIWTILAESAYSNHYTSIANNAQATFATQKFSSTDTTNKVVTNVLTSMITSADFRLRDHVDAKIIVTQSVYDQYYKELTAIGIANVYLPAPAWAMGQNQAVRTSSPPLMCMGVPVYANAFWDRYINTYENNGTKWHMPHRAVFTINENLLIGVDGVDSWDKIVFHYEALTQLNYIDWQIRIDAKIPQEYLISAAY